MSVRSRDNSNDLCSISVEKGRTKSISFDDARKFVKSVGAILYYDY